MKENYWQRYWSLQRSRRRFLGGAAAVGAGAAGVVLVGCGSSSNSSKTPSGTSPAGSSTASGSATASGSSTASGNDPFKNAKPGGTFRSVTTGDPPTLHPYKNLSFTVKGFASYVYSRLMKYDTQWDKDPALLEPTGDLAEKVESNPDGTQWTVTLRDQIFFQDVAPVSGRALDMDDIKYSWSQMVSDISQNRSQVAFVDHLEYPDAKTVKFILKTPNAAFKDVLADANLFWVIPKEADGKVDIAKTPVGTGPWQMTNYTPSSSFSFAKHPKWYDAPRPYIDKIELAIMTSYAQRKAQFIAGNTDVSDLISDDLASVRDGRKGTQFTSITPQLMSFFYFDHVSQAQSPWQKDPRVRQAISQCIDRDSLDELAFEIEKVKKQGFDITVNWNNLIPAGMKRWWLDPKSSGQGDSAKYFKYDAKNAKALLEAAGAGGMSVKFQYPATIYGQVFDSVAQANIQFMQAIGINVQTDVQNYQSQYITQTFSGNFTGIAFGYETPFPEGGSYPIRFFTDNPLNHDQVKDQQLADLATKQQQELDPAKRKDLFNQIQQLNAEKMYYVPNQAGAGPAWTSYSPQMQGVTHINT
ncbi:ABC transporter substrate-binding protein, partial [bacterium]|nr:ABC transporter substrate-binding protein [bacterium]